MGHRHHHWWPPFHRRHPHYLLLVVKVSSGTHLTDSFAVIIPPNRKVHLMENVTLGHVIALAISYLDQNGQPMVTAPTPDSPPTWTDTTPATETLVVAADGSTAQATPIAVGTDTINLSVVVGGATFAAALNVNVSAAPQVLTSVAVSATVQ